MIETKPLVLLLFLLLLSGGCVAREPEMDSELPIATMSCVVQADQNDQFVDNLRAFAELNQFAIRVGHPTPDAADFTIQLWREDVKMILVNPFAAHEFRIQVYKNEQGTLSSELVDKLVKQLRDSVKGVAVCQQGDS